MADSPHSLLYSDCKEAANRFRTYLWPSGFSAENEKTAKIISFDENSHYSLIPICIDAVEKARHQIPLYTPVRLMYEWVIREDGSSAWRRMHVERTAFGLEQIDFKVIHLRPCENGYSKNYGFPHVKDYVRDGFVDFFWLKGNQLAERFSDSPFAFPEGFYDEQKYVNYWEEDPFGWADYAAEPYDENED